MALNSIDDSSFARLKSLKFEGKIRAQWGILSRQILPLGTNAPAYSDGTEVTKGKSFITWKPKLQYRSCLKHGSSLQTFLPS
jgi:hypothetical protein